MIKLEKYSFGLGDRFGLEGEFQLNAILGLAEKGVRIAPVWNKSHREHLTVGSVPAQVTQEAVESVNALGWEGPYHVDADHITLKTVENYLEYADFFTIDVADKIDTPLSTDQMEQFHVKYGEWVGTLSIEGIDEPVRITPETLSKLGNRYWLAAVEAGKIYGTIASVKSEFIAEVSMDEVKEPQNPYELYFILRMLADNGVRLQTIAPKFPGNFLKGVDYVGDIRLFEKEFDKYLYVIKVAVKEFNLPENLKLSIHTGSDKFVLYPVIKSLIRSHDTGIHLKTAGTTWLEETIGLALSGEKGLNFVKWVYRHAYLRFEELTALYENVLDIEKETLIPPGLFEKYSSNEVAATLRHDRANVLYNRHVRQLMHTAYKIAAENLEEFEELVSHNRQIIGRQVYENLLYRHLIPLFL